MTINALNPGPGGSPTRRTPTRRCGRTSSGAAEPSTRSPATSTLPARRARRPHLQDGEPRRSSRPRRLAPAREAHRGDDGEPGVREPGDFAALPRHLRTAPDRSWPGPPTTTCRRSSPTRGAALERRLPARPGLPRHPAHDPRDRPIETHPAAFRDGGDPHELRDHSAGLQRRRWDHVQRHQVRFRTRARTGCRRPQLGDDDGAVDAPTPSCRADLPPAPGPTRSAWRPSSRARTRSTTRSAFEKPGPIDKTREATDGF